MSSQKKPSILLLIKGAAGELDWVMPLIFQLSKNHNIFTYFRSKRAYAMVKSTEEIFYYWKKINTGYFIDNIYRNFYWRLLRKFYLFFINNEKSINFFNQKIHNINFLKEIFLEKNLNSDFKFIFSEYNYPNGWIDSVLEKKNKSLIIHYPHSPFISFLKKPFKRRYELRGDVLLVSGKGDFNRWRNFIDIRKIYNLGIPRYDNLWVKNITKLKKNNLKNKKNKFIVTIPYKSFFDLYSKEKNKLEKQFHDILETLLDFQNIVIIFKIHPRINSRYFYNLLVKYKNFKNRIVVSNSHLFILAKNSNLFICNTNTATILDGIYFGVPTIQFSPAFKNIDKKENINDFYEKNKISIIFNNKKELKKILKDIMLEKNSYKWRLQQKNFKRFFQNENSILRIVNFFQQKYDNKYKNQIDV
jgi:hypothetical protein